MGTTQNSINELILGINKMLSEGSGRFTTEEVMILQQTVDALKRLQTLDKEKQGIQIAVVVINLMRFLFSDKHDVIEMIKHWFDNY